MNGAHAQTQIDALQAEVRELREKQAEHETFLQRINKALATIAGLIK